MLIGEYNQNLDAKGRLNIPSKFRNDLGEAFVVSKGLDNSVWIYPKEEWLRFTQELESAPADRRRKLQRFFCSGAEECSIDSQGRVVLPAKIREYANITKEVVVVGVSNKVEVWNSSAWESYMDDPQFDADEIAKVMEEIGI